ncbi:hypothetical protein RUM43_000633 [Polyplax serrata]|uniref:Thioredoxin domain-containing protein n=1 Tax=Polyplax serrata TaxID=468196 RepID=A0AAN8XQR1_POLSC
MNLSTELLVLSIICLLAGFSNSITNSLEEIDDNEFINLCATEKYVVVLFSKPQCKESAKIEHELLNIREDLVDSLNAWVVKIQNSNLVQIYSPSKEPALVFMRHGVPLLYHGEVNDDLILHTFRENKEPVVRELDDTNFEHLTQASTGATTGDWFVLFKTCVTSHRLTARWEAVGAALKTRMNVARVNRLEGGTVTARRFGVYTTPTFIFFRQGKMYRYTLTSHDVNALVHFATDGYRKIAKSEPVPVPKSPFDDLTQMIADYIAENNWIVALGGLSIMVGFALALKFRKSLKNKESKKTKKKDKSKLEDKSDKSEKNTKKSK